MILCVSIQVEFEGDHPGAGTVSSDALISAIAMPRRSSLSLILAQTGCDAPGASSTSKDKRASVFSAYGRKYKPHASRVVVDCRSTATTAVDCRPGAFVSFNFFNFEKTF
jgi:hypothetical protein